MGQQIDLVQHHQPGSMEHIGIFERLVIAFGDRQNHHLGRLTQIETGGTHQITHVFNVEYAVTQLRQLLQRMADHMGVKMAELAGIDLHRLGTGRPDTVGILVGLLIALNDGHRQLSQLLFQRFAQQRRFARSRT